jgi:AcrR family transcriptional regulator
MDLSVAPPLQARSLRSFDAILDAAEMLLRDRSFEQITISDIVRASGVSTGSFYARFASKEAMLPVLYGRYDERIAQRSANLAMQVETAATLEDACAAVTAAFAAVLRDNVNLMRAVVQLKRAAPEANAVLSTQRAGSHAAIDSALLRFVPGAPEDKALRAIRAAQFMAVSALREAILFPNAPFATATGAGTGIEAVTAAMMARYIQGESK